MKRSASTATLDQPASPSALCSPPSAKLQRTDSSLAVLVDNTALDDELVLAYCTHVVYATISQSRWLHYTPTPTSTTTKYFAMSLAIRWFASIFRSLRGALRADSTPEQILGALWQSAHLTDPDTLHMLCEQPVIATVSPPQHSLYDQRFVDYIPNHHCLKWLLHGLFQFVSIFREYAHSAPADRMFSPDVAAQLLAADPTLCTAAIARLVDVRPSVWCQPCALFGLWNVEHSIDQLQTELLNRQPWRCARSYGLTVRMWLAGLQSGFVYEQLHARPISYLGCSSATLECLSCNDYDWLFGITDHAGVEHQLFLRINEGDADANTGVFGHIESDQGVWGYLHGTQAGDCGTYVECTDLALARYVPHVKHSWAVLPINTIWSSENRYTDGAQVAYVLLAMSMLLLRRQRKCAPFPEGVAIAAMTSLLSIIQQRALDNAAAAAATTCSSSTSATTTTTTTTTNCVSPLQWPVYLPRELLSLIASFCIPQLPDPPAPTLLAALSDPNVSIAELSNLVYDGTERDYWPDKEALDADKQAALHTTAQSKDLSSTRRSITAIQDHLYDW
jgi:hypothetical protein